MRTLLSWLLGIAGLVAVGYGTFKPWYADRSADQLPLTDLFSGPHPDTADLIASLAVPLLVAGLLALIGLAVSTAALRTGAVLLLAVVTVWLIQHGGIDDLQIGYWNAAFGSLLLTVAAALKP